jgi:redox-sensitive bicupin YhaK (pirin superfamily)
MGSRRVTRTVRAQDTSDGAGVRLRRSLGGAQISSLDPFLLLDEFKSNQGDDYIAGFPDHPHRGFETVTYMLAGAMLHRDSRGNEGELTAGSVQWMTAGRGIIHSEMPRQTDGLMWGFQLWVNLPASDKMREPRYQDIPPGDVPEVRTEGGARVRVVAGEAVGVTGPVSGIVTEPLYLDVAVDSGSGFGQPVSEGHNVFVYVFEGEVELGFEDGSPGEQVSAGHLAVLGDGDEVQARTATAGGGTRFLLVAARPIGEPVARHGPFVMNTREEIHQAVRDFQEGRIG